MYSKSIPFKDFNKNPHNALVNFNLTEPEVFKLMVPLKAMFSWHDRIKGDGVVNLETEEIQEFYTNFEEVLLAAWGEPSSDGLHFRKGGRYDFEESALFAATMLFFLTNPEETGKLLDNIMPEGLTDLVKNADENLQKLAATDGASAEMQAEIERLRAQLASSQAPATS